MTFPQWRALLILGAAQDGARVSEVAARVGVTLPATGRLLRRLERRGLLALETDPDDRRATRARLTERGQATRDAILAYRRGMLIEIARAVTLPGRGDLARGLVAIATELGRYACPRSSRARCRTPSRARGGGPDQRATCASGSSSARASASS